MKQSQKSLIVVGAGLSGATCVAAMAPYAKQITWLQRETPQHTKKTDQRPISLSYATVQFLQNLGLWKQLKLQAGAIKTVHVSEQGRLGCLTLRASDVDLEALGFVVPFDILEQTLYQYAMQQERVACVTVDDILKIENTDVVKVIYDAAQKETSVQADYLVAADGVQSRCRTLLGITVQEKNRHDVALSALIKLQQPHQQVAYERFTKQGVMALLPMWDTKQYRLVWTLDGTQAEALTETTLLEKVRDVFGSRIGVVKQITQTGHYPLKTVLATQQVKNNGVLLGDSAHRIYPIAAQGYNLTVRDCAVLVDVLREQHPLSEYATLRRRDQRFIVGLTQSLEWVFGLQLPLLDHLRATALLKLDLLPPLKRQLIERILGRSGRQPSLLCAEL